LKSSKPVFNCYFGGYSSSGFGTLMVVPQVNIQTPVIGCARRSIKPLVVEAALPVVAVLLAAEVSRSASAVSTVRQVIVGQEQPAVPTLPNTTVMVIVIVQVVKLIARAAIKVVGHGGVAFKGLISK